MSISLTGFSTTEDQPRKIMEKIIRKEFKDKPRRVFFVDLSGTTKNEYLVNDLVELATLAVSDNWEVIVSTSCGGGWTLHGLSPTHDNIAKVLNSMKLHYQFVESKDFSDEEAKIFIQTFEVGVDKLKNDGIEIGNNPRLMSLFTKTSSSDRRYDMTKYEQRRLMYSDYLRKFAKDLIDLLERREFDTHLRDCLLMLEHARHSVPLPEDLKLDYADSYVAREHLIYVANKDTFEIRMHIPALYDYLIVDLKKRYSKPDSDIHSNPIVQGYMFETAFLSSKLLREHPLTIQAVNSDQPASPRTFQFPSLNPCGSQLLGALTTNLEENCVYHLRNRHPAIDGVCVTCIDAKKYLLLLQVSLSPYKDHVSKGNDIIKQCIPSKEGGMGTRKTIAEYYQHLGGDIPNDQVIYVYVSPEETRSPNDVIFNHELTVSDTRSGCGSQQKFWYGFLDSAMERLMKQIMDSIGL